MASVTNYELNHFQAIFTSSALVIRAEADRGSNFCLD